MAKSAQDIPYVPACFDLEEEVVDQLSSRPGSQRCVVGRDELLLIVHDLPRPRSSERDPIVFWRRRDGVWVDSGGSRGLRRLSELVDRFAEEVKRHEELVDEADTAAEVFALARVAGPLARSSRNLTIAIEQTVVQDEDSRELKNLRDRCREVERAAELLYHDAKLTLEFWQAERSEEQQAAAERLNKIAFRLNLLAGFFLPLVALGGLFGMNVDLPHFTKSQFWVIVLMGLSLGVGILVMVARRTGKSSE